MYVGVCCDCRNFKHYPSKYLPQMNVKNVISYLMFLFAAFLIVGGIGQDTNGIYYPRIGTEVIDVSNSNITKSFGNLPDARFFPLGGLLGSSPIICGGSDKSCISFRESQWTQTHTTTIRGASASVQVNATTIWILGGYGDTTEFIGIDSSVGIPGPKLPISIYYTCAVKFSEDQIFVIGGESWEDDCEYSQSCWNKVFIFNPLNGFTHIEGPSLKIGRRSHSCGLMSNAAQHKKIVVAGGFGYSNPHDYTPKLSSVEIFYPYVNKDWVTGKNYTVFKIQV